MNSMLLRQPAPVESAPLAQAELPVPEIQPDELLVRVKACGVCHTDLHIVEGELPLPRLPIVPGHQIVGVVEKAGPRAKGFLPGDRVGVAWLHETCGACRFCAQGAENLCENARFTGLHTDGGYAEFATVRAEFAYSLPQGYSDAEAAPLLCAGIVGYRALKRSGIRPGGRLGFIGFGASAHIAMQVAQHWKCAVSVFTRAEKHQRLARKLGASWVGRAEETPPTPLDGIVLFAPSGALVPRALELLDRAGTLSLAGIHMTGTPSLDYARHLYHEKTMTSVANATRADGREFLDLAGRLHLRTATEVFPLTEANKALLLLKQSRIEASAVLTI